MTTPPTVPDPTAAADAAQQAADSAAQATDAAAAETVTSTVRTLHETDNGVHSWFFRSNGQSDAAIWSDGLFMLIFWFSVFFFVLLMGLMVYWCVIYRRRPGVAPPPSPAHNTPLEVFWTVVPSSSLLVLFFLGFWGYMDKVVPAGNAIQLDIRAWKWDWGVTYPDGTQSGQLVTLGGRDDIKIHALPEDTEIALTMISNDVIHSFWIPDQRIKMDVFPNRYTGYGFRTPLLNEGDVHEDGTYRDHWVFCAEYCGTKHSEMAAVIRVMPQEDYEAWLEDQSGAGLSPIDLGKRVHQGKCATCHSVDGSDNIGPTWLDLYGSERSFNDGSSAIADENYIRESILNPGARISQGSQNQMTSFQGIISEDEISNVIAYMKSISEHAGADDGSAPADDSTDQAPEDSAAPEGQSEG